MTGRRASGIGTIAAASIVGVLCAALLVGVDWRGVFGSYFGRLGVAECTGGKSIEVACYVSRYEALTRAAGPAVALADLDDKSARSGFVAAACHQLTHVIGRTAGETHGRAAFDRGTDLCASGYYHGVVEAIVTAMGPVESRAHGDSVCAELRQTQPYSFLHYNCVHGMGHGFMATFESDVFQSLTGCDVLRDPWEQPHCYSGVFMENLTAITSPSRPSKALRPSEPLYPCTEVDTRYKWECYLKQTAYAVLVHNDDFGAVFRECLHGADADFLDACYQGVGGDVAIRSSKYVIGERNQAVAIRELCLLGPTEDARSTCVEGAVTTIIRDLSGEDEKARSLCAVLDGGLAAVCDATRKKPIASFASPGGGAHQHH